MYTSQCINIYVLCIVSSDGNNGVINKRQLLTALLFSVTSNQTNYCFPRYNAVTVTDNKMRRYYNLL